MEATGVRDIPSGPLLRIGDDRFIPGLQTRANRARSQRWQTRLFIQIIDFLAVKNGLNRKVLSAWQLHSRHRQLLAEVTGDAQWLSADERDVRSSQAQLKQLLSRFWTAANSRLCALAIGGVTDTHLAHVRDLPQVCRASLLKRRGGARGRI